MLENIKNFIDEKLREILHHFVHKRYTTNYERLKNGQFGDKLEIK
jgi:hypothetical protein